MTTLYELGAEFAALEEVLVANGGELTPEVEAALTNLGEIQAEKVDAYRAVAASFAAYAAKVSDEMALLAAKKQAAEKAEANLKRRLLEYMTARGVTELKGTIWKAAIQKNGGKPPVTVLVEPTALPSGLQRITVSPDADRIRAVATNGQVVVDGVLVAQVENVGTHLRFR